MGSSNENSGYGPVRNPWDRERVPGGSSGGSAAAVAGRLAPWAIGTDTGGSIRQPASLCGIVGLKPTYGAISRFGMVAFASSLDQCGPLTRTVTDAALLLRELQGRDRHDATSVGIEGGVRAAVARLARGPALRGRPRLLPPRRGRRGRGRRGLRAFAGLIERLGGSLEEIDAAERRARDLRLLRDRAGGGVGQPRPLRRRPLRDPRARRHARRDVRAHPRPGLRRRGQAADHARHLRALLGLLRRLLRARAEGADEDRRGLRDRVRDRRPDRHPDLAHGRLRARRPDRRPAGDVSLRLLHRADVARRDPGDLDPGRARAAGRQAAPSCRSDCRSPRRPSPSRGCSTPRTRSRAAIGFDERPAS